MPADTWLLNLLVSFRSSKVTERKDALPKLVTYLSGRSAVELRKSILTLLDEEAISSVVLPALVGELVGAKPRPTCVHTCVDLLSKCESTVPGGLAREAAAIWKSLGSTLCHPKLDEGFRLPLFEVLKILSSHETYVLVLLDDSLLDTFNDIIYTSVLDFIEDGCNSKQLGRHLTLLGMQLEVVYRVLKFAAGSMTSVAVDVLNCIRQLCSARVSRDLGPQEFQSLTMVVEIILNLYVFNDLPSMGEAMDEILYCLVEDGFAPRYAPPVRVSLVRMLRWRLSEMENSTLQMYCVKLTVPMWRTHVWRIILDDYKTRASRHSNSQGLLARRVADNGLDSVDLDEVFLLVELYVLLYTKFERDSPASDVPPVKRSKVYWSWNDHGALWTALEEAHPQVAQRLWLPFVELLFHSSLPIGANDVAQCLQVVKRRLGSIMSPSSMGEKGSRPTDQELVAIRFVLAAVLKKWPLGSVGIQDQVNELLRARSLVRPDSIHMESTCVLLSSVLHGGKPFRSILSSALLPAFWCAIVELEPSWGSVGNGDSMYLHRYAFVSLLMQLESMSMICDDVQTLRGDKLSWVARFLRAETVQTINATTGDVQETTPLRILCHMKYMWSLANVLCGWDHSYSLMIPSLTTSEYGNLILPNVFLDRGFSEPMLVAMKIALSCFPLYAKVSRRSPLSTCPGYHECAKSWFQNIRSAVFRKQVPSLSLVTREDAASILGLLKAEGTCYKWSSSAMAFRVCCIARDAPVHVKRGSRTPRCTAVDDVYVLYFLALSRGNSAFTAAAAELVSMYAAERAQSMCGEGVTDGLSNVLHPQCSQDTGSLYESGCQAGLIARVMSAAVSPANDVFCGFNVEECHLSAVQCQHLFPAIMTLSSFSKPEFMSMNGRSAASMFSTTIDTVHGEFVPEGSLAAMKIALMGLAGTVPRWVGPVEGESDASHEAGVRKSFLLGLHEELSGLMRQPGLTRICRRWLCCAAANLGVSMLGLVRDRAEDDGGTEITDVLDTVLRVLVVSAGASEDWQTRFISSHAIGRLFAECNSVSTIWRKGTVSLPFVDAIDSIRKVHLRSSPSAAMACYLSELCGTLVGENPVLCMRSVQLLRDCVESSDMSGSLSSLARYNASCGHSRPKDALLMFCSPHSLVDSNFSTYVEYADAVHRLTQDVSLRLEQDSTSLSVSEQLLLVYFCTAFTVGGGHSSVDDLSRRLGVRSLLKEVAKSPSMAGTIFSSLVVSGSFDTIGGRDLGDRISVLVKLGGCKSIDQYWSKTHNFSRSICVAGACMIDSLCGSLSTIQSLFFIIADRELHYADNLSQAQIFTFTIEMLNALTTILLDTITMTSFGEETAVLSRISVCSSLLNQLSDLLSQLADGGHWEPVARFFNTISWFLGLLNRDTVDGRVALAIRSLGKELVALVGSSWCPLMPIQAQCVIAGVLETEPIELSVLDEYLSRSRDAIERPGMPSRLRSFILDTVFERVWLTCQRNVLPSPLKLSLFHRCMAWWGSVLRIAGESNRHGIGRYFSVLSHLASPSVYPDLYVNSRRSMEDQSVWMDLERTYGDRVVLDMSDSKAVWQVLHGVALLKAIVDPLLSGGGMWPVTRMVRLQLLCEWAETSPDDFQSIAGSMCEETLIAFFEPFEMVDSSARFLSCTLLKGIWTDDCPLLFKPVVESLDGSSTLGKLVRVMRREMGFPGPSCQLRSRHFVWYQESELTRDRLRVDDTRVWGSLSEVGYEVWVTELTGYLLHMFCATDSVLAMLALPVLGSVELAEMLFPMAILRILSESADLHAVLSEAVRKYIVEASDLPRCASLILATLNALGKWSSLIGLCNPPGVIGSPQMEQSSPAGSDRSSRKARRREGSLKTLTKRIRSAPKGKLSGMAKYVYVLDIPYELISRFLFRARGSPFASLMFAERSCEVDAVLQQLSESDVLGEEDTRMIASVYKSIGSEVDPDGLYGIIQMEKSFSRRRLLVAEHEQEQRDCLELYDRMLSTNQASSEELPAIRGSIVRTLLQLGYSHILEGYIRGSIPEQDSRSSQLSAIHTETLWKMSDWGHFPPYPSPSTRSTDLNSICENGEQYLNHACFFAGKLLSSPSKEATERTGLVSCANTAIDDGYRCFFKVLDSHGTPGVYGLAALSSIESVIRGRDNTDIRSLMAVWHEEVSGLQGQPRSRAVEMLQSVRYVLAAVLRNTCSHGGTRLAVDGLISAMHETSSRIVQSIHSSTASGQDTALSTLRALEEAKSMWKEGKLDEAAWSSRRLVASVSGTGSSSTDIPTAVRVRVLASVAMWLHDSNSEQSQSIANHLTRALTMCSGLDDNRLRGKVVSRLARFSDACYMKHVQRISAEDYVLKAALISERKKQYEEYKTSHASMKVTHKKDAQLERRLLRDMQVARKELEQYEEEQKIFIDQLLSYWMSSVEYHIQALQLVDKYDLKSIYRLWKLLCDGVQVPSTSIQSNATRIHENAWENALEGVPLHKWLILAYQIVGRLGSKIGDLEGDRSVLERLVTELLVKYPKSSALQVISIRNGDRIFPGLPVWVKSAYQLDHAKIESATRIWQTASNHSESVREILDDYSNLVDAYIRLAFLHIDSTENLRLSESRPTSLVMRGRKKEHIPVPTVSCDPSMVASGEFVGIAGFDSSFKLAGGINQPKIVLCKGTDGNMYRQLVKGRDDMRQDAVMQQIFSLVNGVLAASAEAGSRRNLRMRTYVVVPLTPAAGILGWVEDTMPIGQYLVGGGGETSHIEGAHSRYRPKDWSSRECRKVMDAVGTSDAKKKLREFRRVCSHIKPVFHNFFLEQFPDPKDWFERRLTYTRSVAVNSIVGYTVGLGDRHSQNILLDQTTAEVVHIDLGIAFEQGKLLRFPERVPFRLTRDIIDGMGISGTEGVFRRCSEVTMNVLRSHKELILTVLEVFLYDPLYNWSLAPLQMFKAHKGSKRGSTSKGGKNPDVILIGDDGDDDLFEEDAGNAMSGTGKSVSGNRDAQRVLLRIRDKLNGIDEDASNLRAGEPLNVPAHVDRLIHLAQREDYLSAMFPGWAPWL